MAEFNEQTLMLLFTGVIALSTVVYAYYSIRLWKATRASADIAKATAFTNYLIILAKEAEKAKANDPRAATFLEQVAMLLTETAMENFLEDIDLKKEPRMRDALNKLDGLLRSQNIDPSQVPWFRPVISRLQGK